MNKDFNYQQKERLIVEQEIRYWGKRWNEIKSKALRFEVDSRVRDTILSYETQIPCLEYHLDRYERLKK